MRSFEVRDRRSLNGAAFILTEYAIENSQRDHAGVRANQHILVNIDWAILVQDASIRVQAPVDGY